MLTLLTAHNRKFYAVLFTLLWKVGLTSVNTCVTMVTVSDLCQLMTEPRPTRQKGKENFWKQSQRDCGSSVVSNLY